MMKTNDDRGPDDTAGGQETPLNLSVRMIGEPDYPFALLSGSRDALEFLASIILAVTRSENLPAKFELAPFGPGQFHLSEDSDLGIYIECVPREE